MTIKFSSNNYNSSINLLSKEIADNSPGSIALIPIGEKYDKDQINLLFKSLKNKINDKIIVSSDLVETLKESNQLLVLSSGCCT